MKLESKLTLIFYTSASIIFTLPLLFTYIAKIDNQTLNNILLLLKPTFNIKAIGILLSLVYLIIIYDLFLYKDKEQLKKNIFLFENIFGKNVSLTYNMTISLLSGYFEELLFRGYLYYVLIIILKKFIVYSFYLDLTTFLTISIIFAFFHIIQGKEAFIISLIISIAFLISIKTTRTLWYAIGSHSLINFLELTVVVPLQKKKLKK